MPDSANADLLQRRYGRTGHQWKQRPVLLAIIATIVVLIGALLAGYWLYGQSTTTVYHVGYTVESPSEVTVRYSVVAPEGSDIRCTLRAVNDVFAEVGVREVDHEDFAGGTQNFIDTVTTTELASAAEAEFCDVVN